VGAAAIVAVLIADATSKATRKPDELGSVLINFGHVRFAPEATWLLQVAK
jgi:hypothetical protein